MTYRGKIKVAKLGAIKRIHDSKKFEIFILIFFLVFSLRVLNWFEHPNIIAGGDLRPPFVQEAFNKRVLYTWDEIDFGLPSVYSPRVLSPSYLSISVFQNMGVDLFSSQVLTFFLMYFFASVLMYIYVKQLTNGDKIAAFIAALFVTSNVYLVTDREQTAIGFVELILMILPSAIAFTQGIKKKSNSLLALSGILFTLTFGTFPNYRPALISLGVLLLTFLFLFMSNRVNIRLNTGLFRRLTAFLTRRRLVNLTKNGTLFITGVLSASLWIIVLILANWGSIMGTLGSMTSPNWILEQIRFQDIPRLIEKWSFYTVDLGKPYVFYADNYLYNPVVLVLSYLPPIFALFGAVISKSRRLALFFGGTALISLILASAAIPELYTEIVTRIPFLIAFRESAQWLFFTIFSYSILTGLFASTLFFKIRKNILKITALALIIGVFVVSSYPLMNGDVTRNWLDIKKKGANLPSSYIQLNNELSNNYWTLFLPNKDTYIPYNFSGEPLNLGNPYPLIFSKPVVSGLGTEYMKANNFDTINAIYGNFETNVAPRGMASAKSNDNIPIETSDPVKAIDRDASTQWTIKQPQTFQIDWNENNQWLSRVNIIFNGAYANNYIIEAWNGSEITNKYTITNNTSFTPEYTYYPRLQVTKLRITFLEINSSSPVSIKEIEVYSNRYEISPEFLGFLGIKHIVLEKNVGLNPVQNVSQARIENENFALANEWDEVALYNNTYALNKLYPADNILIGTFPDEMYQTVQNTDWDTLQHSIFLDSAFNETKGRNTLPSGFSMKQLSPTNYEVNVNSQGSFFLVFLESFDINWKTSVNGIPVSEENHIMANSFANAWLIESTGDLKIMVRYETQNIFVTSVVASTVLPILLLTFLVKKKVKEILVSVSRRFRHNDKFA